MYSHENVLLIIALLDNPRSINPASAEILRKSRAMQDSG